MFSAQCICSHRAADLSIAVSAPIDYHHIWIKRKRWRLSVMEGRHEWNRTIQWRGNSRLFKQALDHSRQKIEITPKFIANYLSMYVITTLGKPCLYMQEAVRES